MSEISRNPLCWPDSVPRTAPNRRSHPRFGEKSLASAASFVLAEINRLNNQPWNSSDKGIIISSNLRLKQDGLPQSDQRDPADSGIAVYFTLRLLRNGKVVERPIVMSCDKWWKPADNLYAIGKDIEAQRARARWGCTNYEQSFRGYVAIPERCGGAAWWVTLGIPSTAGRIEVEAAYKTKAKTGHPDVGGAHEAWLRIQEAFDQAMGQFR